MDSGRNIYKDEVNFTELASQDDDFAKLLKPNGQLDFSDPAAVQQLTKALLRRDFKLSLALPADRLCPPVTNRLNYVLWIQDLLDTTSESYSDRYDPKREVTGLDIGTGASCIYPLLGCVQRPKWRFIATDIDDHSLNYAQTNINANDLSSRIKLLKTRPIDPLIPLDSLGMENIDFTLCNPPFYASPEEFLASATQKSRPPNSACTGSATEMVTPGGEVAFTLKHLAESLLLRERVQWYTTMLGKLSSVPIIVEKLKGVGVTNWAVAEFVQGTRTRRWGVGWSFVGRRPSLKAARAVGLGSGVEKKFLPFPGEAVVGGGGGGRGDGDGEEKTDVETVGRRIDAFLSELPMRWVWKAGISTGVGFAGANVWSRAARRKQIRSPRKEKSDEEDDEEDEEEEMAFGFKITVKVREADGSQGEEVEGNRVQVGIRWLKGFDSALFESFCGMVKRKLGE